MISSREGLSIAELIFYVPILPIAAYLVFRHGFSRQAGWLYIALLCTLRLVGAACLIAADQTPNPSTSLVEAGYITSAVGTGPLLLSLLRFLQTISDGMSSNRSLSNQTFRVAHLLLLAGLGVYIAGAVLETESNSTGPKLFKAGSILFVVFWLCEVGFTAYFAMHSRDVAHKDRHVLRACVVVIPFVLVRMAYTVATGFSSPGSTFYFLDANVYVQAFMQFAMEAVFVLVFLAAGLMTPRRDASEGQKRVSVESGVPMMERSRR